MTESMEVPQALRVGLGPKPDVRLRTVMVAEDDPDMRRMLADWLSSIGCAVIECDSGAELIDRLLAMPAPHLAYVDAIVTDERMPGFNGLEALEMLWFVPLPPVLLITAYGDDRIVARARALGGVDVLPKPFDRNAFVATVTGLLA